MNYLIKNYPDSKRISTRFRNRAAEYPIVIENFTLQSIQKSEKCNMVKKNLPLEKAVKVKY